MSFRCVCDCHLHTHCSPDGADTAAMMCQEAVRLGMYAVTFTDHCECNKFESDQYSRRIEKSRNEVKRAALTFEGKIKVFSGIELGQPLQNPVAAKEATENNQFDFVLCSVHNVRGREDFYSIDYSSVPVSDVLNQYFDEVLETAKWGNFDSLAHLTYPLRYIVGEHKIHVDPYLFSDKIDDILKILVENDKALEVNTSGLRQKIGTTLPDFDIIKRFHDLGGKYITIGSDAHRWADVGFGLEQGLCLIKKAGFAYYTVFDKHVPVPIPIG